MVDGGVLYVAFAAGGVAYVSCGTSVRYHVS